MYSSWELPPFDELLPGYLICDHEKENLMIVLLL